MLISYNSLDRRLYTVYTKTSKTISRLIILTVNASIYRHTEQKGNHKLLPYDLHVKEWYFRLSLSFTEVEKCGVFGKMVLTHVCLPSHNSLLGIIFPSWFITRVGVHWVTWWGTWHKEDTAICWLLQWVFMWWVWISIRIPETL